MTYEPSPESANSRITALDDIQPRRRKAFEQNQCAFFNGPIRKLDDSMRLKRRETMRFMDILNILSQLEMMQNKIN